MAKLTADGGPKIELGHYVEYPKASPPPHAGDRWPGTISTRVCPDVEVHLEAIPEALIDVLNGAASSPGDGIVGYAANFDFWVDEIVHCGARTIG